MMIGGGVLGAAALAGIVLTTMALTGGKPTPSPTATALKSPTASPKPTTPTTPAEVLSSVTTDTAQTAIATLFPAQKPTIQGRQYVLTAHDTDECAKGSEHGLAEALAAKNCARGYRVTYVSGPTEVTVGVFTFRDAASASAAMKNAGSGTVTPLVAGHVTPFCQNVACQTTAAALGRYLYFTIAGPGNGKPADGTDQASLLAARDIATSVHDTLYARGKAALAQLPTNPAAPSGTAKH